MRWFLVVFLAACDPGSSGEPVKPTTADAGLRDEVDALTDRVEALEAALSASNPSGWPARGTVYATVTAADCGSGTDGAWWIEAPASPGPGLIAFQSYSGGDSVNAHGPFYPSCGYHDGGPVCRWTIPCPAGSDLTAIVQ